MARIKPLETVERALEVLRALSALGTATVSDLARFTGMPRAAVNRYVVTFESLGYAYRKAGSTQYRVSSQALELTSGVTVDDWVRRDAVPEMETLSRKSGWPVGLETVRDSRLTILANTDHISPLVTRRITTDMRLPLVGRASGHVLLAQMNDLLRRDILNTAGLDDPNLYKRAALTPEKLSRMIASTKSAGYAVQKVPRVDWTVIAVPLSAPGNLVLSLSLRFRDKVVDAEAVTHDILPALSATAGRISKRLSQRTQEA